MTWSTASPKKRPERKTGEKNRRKKAVKPDKTASACSAEQLALFVESLNDAISARFPLTIL
jgi:hypothetical protein